MAQILEVMAELSADIGELMSIQLLKIFGEHHTSSLDIMYVALFIIDNSDRVRDILLTLIKASCYIKSFLFSYK